MRILLISLILFCSCSEDRNFFSSFDEVTFYHLNKNTYSGIFKDSLLELVVLTNSPDKLDEKPFFLKLSSNEFSKVSLKKKDVLALKNSVFIYKNASPIDYGLACAPIYRDILILKKNNKNIGIAKICFHCNKFHFVNNKPDVKTNNFGRNNEFINLRKMLGKYQTILK